MASEHLAALREWGETYIEATLPVMLIKPGMKKALAGRDGSWMVFTELEPLGEALARYPDANLAVVLGRERGSPVVAVDIDGGRGLDRARELGVSSHEEVWIARTGRGNWHIVYRYPDDVELARTIGADDLPLDLLTNGYILVEPSVTAGAYRWQPGHSPKDLSVSKLYPPPKPLLDWWLSQAKPGDHGGEGWQDKELVDALNGVGKGQRDITGYRLACRHLALGLRPEEVEEFLVLWAGRCRPPIGDAPGDERPEAWARAKVKSAVRAFDRGKLRRKPRRRESRHGGRIPDMEIGLP
jgi:hypothetical protein